MDMRPFIYPIHSIFQFRDLFDELCEGVKEKANLVVAADCDLRILDECVGGESSLLPSGRVLAKKQF